jgi:hypothetical protein
MDTPQPMTVVNRTSQPVEIVYVVKLSSDAEGSDSLTVLPAGETRTISGVFGGGGTCLPGRFDAVQGTATIATVDKPCEGGRWDITE